MTPFRCAWSLLSRPDAAWDTIAGEQIDLVNLLRRWILPLSLIAPVGLTIGATFFDREWNAKLGYAVLPGQIFPAALTTFVASILAVFMLAGVFSWIAPLFGTKRAFNAALKVAVFGAVPVWAAGALLFLMPMIIAVMIAFFYSCYLYYIGVVKILGVAEEQAAEFVAISMLFMSLGLMLTGAVGGWIGVL